MHLYNLRTVIIIYRTTLRARAILWKIIRAHLVAVTWLELGIFTIISVHVLSFSAQWQIIISYVFGIYMIYLNLEIFQSQSMCVDTLRFGGQNYTCTWPITSWTPWFHIILMMKVQNKRYIISLARFLISCHVRYSCVYMYKLVFQCF